MNILILTDVFFPDTIGGAGRVAHYLCLELSKKGHEVHVITRNKDAKLLSYEKFYQTFFVHRFLLPQNESLSLFFKEVIKSFSLTKKICKEIPFDLICIHQSMAAIGPLLSGYLNGIPVIYHFHSPWHEEYLIKKRTADKNFSIGDRVISLIMKTIEKRIIQKSKKVIVLSDYMGKKVSRVHGYPQDGISIIPGGVDLNRFHLPIGGKTAVKKELDLPQDRTIFLTIRNLVPRMGLESLIEAFNHSKVLKEKGLMLIGGRGALKSHLLELVRENSLEDSIRFLGYIPEGDLPKFYQAADYFVLPTKNLEGFGLVILEAMSCGTPVLGTPVGAIPEILGSFDESLLFDGSNWHDLKSKMENVIEHPERYQYNPQACRNFVTNNFSWEKVGDRFEEEALKLIKN